MDEKEKVQQQSEGCSSDCSHCASAGNCGSQPHSLLEETNSFNNIKKVIAIVSGKGGVGKSLVTSLMAVNMQRKGYRTSILDADITGFDAELAHTEFNARRAVDSLVFTLTKK